MLKFLKLLGPAPFIDPIQDPREVGHLYKKWRIRTLYSMFIGYMFYYFSRKSFTFAMPGLIADLGYEKAELGILASTLSITYGVSKFASGILGDRSNPRYFMAIGLILTGVLNICFGMSSSILFFALFWGLNGWFQGFGWPGCARLLTHWYSHSERGRWWSVWNISHNAGGAIIPLLAAWAAYYFGWRYAMYIPGGICILGGLFLINRLRDTPQSLGLPSIEEWRNDYDTTERVASFEEKELSTKEALMDYVLKNPYIWLLAFAGFFIYIIRQAFNDWTQLYLIQDKGYDQLSGGFSLTLFEMGGLVGSLFAGWFSDRFTKGRRGPVNILFSLGLLGSTLFFWLAPWHVSFADYLSVFMIGFFVFGPQMLIGLAAAELSHKKAAATATGLVGLVSYIGAAISGYPLGKIADVWGWDGFFVATSSCCVLATIFLIPTWNISVRSYKLDEDIEGKALNHSA